MKDCRNCGHCTYDSTFGDRRCKVYNHAVKDLDKYVDCQSHMDKCTEVKE